MLNNFVAVSVSPGLSFPKFSAIMVRKCSNQARQSKKANRTKLTFIVWPMQIFRQCCCRSFVTGQEQQEQEQEQEQEQQQQQQEQQQQEQQQQQAHDNEANRVLPASIIRPDPDTSLPLQRRLDVEQRRSKVTTAHLTGTDVFDRPEQTVRASSQCTDERWTATVGRVAVLQWGAYVVHHIPHWTLGAWPEREQTLRKWENWKETGEERNKRDRENLKLTNRN